MATQKKKTTPAKTRAKGSASSVRAKAAKPATAAKPAKAASTVRSAAAKPAVKSGKPATVAAKAGVAAKPSPASTKATSKSAKAALIAVPNAAPAAAVVDGVLRTAKGVAVKDKPWGKKDLAHFEQRLMEERRRVTKQLAQWDESMRSTIQNADGDLSAYSFHMADQGTDAMEREKAFLFASKEGRYLWHIDQALRRLYKSPELFGICEMTGERIEFERLDALPHARLSYKAKRQEEGADDVE